jgi:hypothetical protein
MTVIAFYPNVPHYDAFKKNPYDLKLAKLLWEFVVNNALFPMFKLGSCNLHECIFNESPLPSLLHL